MTRNLKVIVGAVLALGAMAAVSASGAAAAEFHCSVEPCRFRLHSDGTEKLAHQVFIIDDKTTGQSLTITCTRITGEGTSNAKTFVEAVVTGINYNDVECRDTGLTKVTVEMNGCTYHFRAAGQVTVACAAGKKIELKYASGCVITVGPQGPLNGITYTTVGVSPNREVTVSVNVAGIAVAFDGTKAQCGVEPTDQFEGTYTTGNTLVTAETDDVSEAMADGWWL